MYCLRGTRIFTKNICIDICLACTNYFNKHNKIYHNSGECDCVEHNRKLLDQYHKRENDMINEYKNK
jgi:hypothetical protein